MRRRRDEGRALSAFVPFAVEYMRALKMSSVRDTQPGRPSKGAILEVNTSRVHRSCEG